SYRRNRPEEREDHVLARARRKLADRAAHAVAVVERALDRVHEEVVRGVEVLGDRLAQVVLVQGVRRVKTHENGRLDLLEGFDHTPLVRQGGALEVVDVLPRGVARDDAVDRRLELTKALRLAAHAVRVHDTKRCASSPGSTSSFPRTSSSG